MELRRPTHQVTRRAPEGRVSNYCLLTEIAGEGEVGLAIQKTFPEVGSDASARNKPEKMINVKNPPALIE